MSEKSLTIRTFRLRDFVRLYRLQRHGLYLDQESHLVAGYSPILTALRLWPNANARTFIAREAKENAWYALQLLRRDERPEWQVAFLAQSSTSFVADNWRALLEHALHDAVHKGAYRVYASLPARHSLMEVFQQTGFRLYMREEIFRAERPQAVDLPLPGGLRPRHPADEWEFRRLWQRVTPGVVAAAEGLNGGNSLGLPYAWTWRFDQQVFVWEVEGTLQGAVAIRMGEKGRWVRFLLATDVQEEIAAFVMAGIRLATGKYGRPVYCAVPEYIGGVRAPLQDAGFTPLGEQMWLVRYLALPLRADATVSQSILSLLDIGGEPAFTHSLENGGPVLSRDETGSAPSRAG